MAQTGSTPGMAISRFADGLRVRSIVLLPLRERLHIRRRDQADLEPNRLQLPAPVVGAAADLHRHLAGPRFDIASRNRSRDTFLRNAADPSSRAPRSWKLLLPRSTPIMLIFFIVDASFSCGALVPP